VKRLSAAAALSAAAILAAAGGITAAHAATTPAQDVHWIIKGADQYGVTTSEPSVTDPSSGLQNLTINGQAAGAAPANFGYIMCGTWAGYTGAPPGPYVANSNPAVPSASPPAGSFSGSDRTTCGTTTGGAAAAGDGNLPVFENVTAFEDAVNDGLFSQLGISHAVYDIEVWLLTPVSQNGCYYPSSDTATAAERAAESTTAASCEEQHPGRVTSAIDAAVKFAKAHDIDLIVSPGGALATTDNDDYVAVAGAWMVGIQSQGWGGGSNSVTTFTASITTAVNDLRATRRKHDTGTLIMLGLGTNTPVVHSASYLESAFTAIRDTDVSWVWLNANAWQAESKCTVLEGGQGCPVIGVTFMSAVDPSFAWEGS
jgi:hypothetical protein